MNYRLIPALGLCSVLACALDHQPVSSGESVAALSPTTHLQAAACQYKIYGCCWDSFPVICDPLPTAAAPASRSSAAPARTSSFIDPDAKGGLSRRAPRETRSVRLRSGSTVQFTPLVRDSEQIGVLVAERTAPGVRPIANVALARMNPLELYWLLGGVGLPEFLAGVYDLPSGLPWGAFDSFTWEAPSEPFCDPGGPESGYIFDMVAGHQNVFGSAGDGPFTKPQHWWMSVSGSPNDLYALQGNAFNVSDFKAVVAFCNRDDISSFPSATHPRFAWIQSRPAAESEWGEENYLYAELTQPGQVFVGSAVTVPAYDADEHDFRVLIDFAKPGDTFHIAAGWDD